MRNLEFAKEEYYHIFNRGVDKRDIFMDEYDIKRFFQSMDEFNIVDPVGSIYVNSFNKKLRSSAPKFKTKPKLVNFVSYCLNSNHYHFILEPLVDGGIEKFMHKIGTGYTNFFNNKYLRSGSLFQGKYKAVHIDSNEYLLYLSVYVNLNNKVHFKSLRSSTPKSKSSWDEYLLTNRIGAGFCKKNVVLDQFNNNYKYEDFARETFDIILENKEFGQDANKLLLE